jgi:hypothetical protein
MENSLKDTKPESGKPFKTANGAFGGSTHLPLSRPAFAILLVLHSVVVLSGGDVRDDSKRGYWRRNHMAGCLLVLSTGC